MFLDRTVISFSIEYLINFKRQEHSMDRDRLTVTVPNIEAQRLMVTVPSALGTSSTTSLNARYQSTAWSAVMHPVPLKDVDTGVQRPPSVNMPQVQEHPSRLHSPTIGVQQLPQHLRPDRTKKLESHVKAFKQIETRDLLVDYCRLFSFVVSYQSY